MLAAGLGGGLALTIKPHFALGLAPAFITLLVYTRSWRLIFALENWIAGAVAAIYGASVLVFYPTFINDIMPMVMATYVPIRQSLLVMLVPVLFAAMQLGSRRGGGRDCFICRQSSCFAPRRAGSFWC